MAEHATKRRGPAFFDNAIFRMPLGASLQFSPIAKVNESSIVQLGPIRMSPLIVDCFSWSLAPYQPLPERD